MKGRTACGTAGAIFAAMIIQAPLAAQTTPSEPSPTPDSSAFAAVTDGEQDQSDNSGMIVVTAQKRAENVQDVPISMIALGGEALTNANVTNVADLQRVVPMGAGSLPRNMTVEIEAILEFE